MYNVISNFQLITFLDQIIVLWLNFSFLSSIEQLNEAQERARKGKTSLSRPIEILNEVLPVFEKACAVYTEKVEASNQVNASLREVEGIRLELKQCERLDIGDVDKAKKLERKGEKILGKLSDCQRGILGY